MNDNNLHNGFCPPVAVGGLGGSGTRLVAQLLKSIGFYIGSDLNNSYDNLWFTFLFKRVEILSLSENSFDELVKIFIKAMTQKADLSAYQIKLINDLSCVDRPQHNERWLKRRANSLLKRSDFYRQPKYCGWGWKEPNTHIVIDRLIDFLPGLKYIHVIRNGLDMAYSNNQNQLTLWGEYFLEEAFEVTPHDSLKFWCLLNRRCIDICNRIESNFLLLNYDQLCIDPKHYLGSLIKFLDVGVTNKQFNKLVNMVKAPDTIGRFKKHGIDIFDPADIMYANQLGFDTHC